MSEFPTYYFKVLEKSDFSGTEREGEKEKEKEHGETIKGPLLQGPNESFNQLVLIFKALVFLIIS